MKLFTGLRINIFQGSNYYTFGTKKMFAESIILCNLNQQVIAFLQFIGSEMLSEQTGLFFPSGLTKMKYNHDRLSFSNQLLHVRFLSLIVKFHTLHPPINKSNSPNNI